MVLLLLHVQVETCLTTNAVASDQYAEEVKVKRKWGSGMEEAVHCALSICYKNLQLTTKTGV